jgi:hypothetical protein
MRKARLLLVPAVTLGLLAVLPPVGAEEPGGGVPGFSAVATHAQGQAATGYFFDVGNEENRLVGALSEIATPPSSSQNIAALVQRGVAASFVYGMAGGGGPGKAGVLPQPPPGEADAFYPAEPLESKYEGPVTAGAKGPVVDGRFSAKASDTPTGRADSAVTALEVPNQLKIDHAVVSSHTEPGDGGIGAESVSVLYGVTLGPLHIDAMVSRAYGFVPAAPGEPKGIATTVVDGATVNGTPVQVTDRGVVVGDQANPGAQQQVNAALAQAGYSDVRLVPSSAKPGEGNESVQALSGTLRVVHRDDKMGQQFQGFAGGGFAVGGAEVRVVGHRCSSGCPVGAGGATGDISAPPVAAVPAAPPGPVAAPTSPSGPSGTGTAAASPPPADSGASATAAGAVETAGSGGMTGASVDGYLPSGGSSSRTATTAVTPPSAAASLGAPASTATPNAARLNGARSPSSLLLSASSELNPQAAKGLRDGILIGAMVLLGAVLLGARIVTR